MAFLKIKELENKIIEFIPVYKPSIDDKNLYIQLKRNIS